MKTTPFTRVGWVWLPSSAAEFIVVIGAAAFCATVFAAVDRHSHSVSDTLYGVYPFFVSTFLLVDWIGRRASVPAPGP